MQKNTEASSFPVLFAADANYVSHLATALFSLLEHNPSLPISVTVLTGEMDARNVYRLKAICAQFGVPCEVLRLDDRLLGGLVTTGHFRLSAYYRLFAPDLIHGPRCLYLDSDLVVTGSIAEILESELDDYLVAGIENTGLARNEELGMKAESLSFNSGVMLMNLDRWRSERVKDAVLDFVRRNPDVVIHADQCGLNAVIDGRWLPLDPVFNYQTAAALAGGRQSAGRSPVIIHFTGAEKPWQMNNSHPFKRVYWRYRNRTPFWSLLPDDFGVKSLVSWLLPARLKEKVMHLKVLRGFVISR